MKAITIIRFNGGCRGLEIERRRREALHKVGRGRGKEIARVR